MKYTVAELCRAQRISIAQFFEMVVPKCYWCLEYLEAPETEEMYITNSHSAMHRVVVCARCYGGQL